MKDKNYAHITSSNIKCLINQRGITISNLAKAIGIPPTTLRDSLYTKKGINIDNLVRISVYFNLTVNDLCNENLLA